MNARNDVKRLTRRDFNARHALAAVRLRLAAHVDFLVAEWLQRCAANVEAAQELFRTDREPLRELRRA
jgi:hypothetical protein